jgi:hypothetical protein
VSQSIPASIQELIDERVFNFAQAAQKHYKTNDLVVLLDLSDERPELEAIPRTRLAESEDIPATLREKVSKPASGLAAVLGAPTQSFWFFVVFESGEGECVAINASMLAPGGRA